MTLTKHVSVMPLETMQALAVHAGGIYVDATVGGGGHTELMLEASAPDGKVIALDRDDAAIERASKRLEGYGDRVSFFKATFDYIGQALDDMGITEVDGILADLGVSSDQLETAERGFSFSQAGPLDMRMDAQNGETLASFLGRVSEHDLANVIYILGEERSSRRIAKAIKDAWKKGEIHDTAELAAVVSRALPPKVRFGRLHPATKTFQALRKAINKEHESLQAFLPAAFRRLCVGGRLAVLTFESGEDRIVKETFRQLSKEDDGRLLTRKPLVPTDEEQRANPRSRSAKLRGIERIEHGQESKNKDRTEGVTQQ